MYHFLDRVLYTPERLAKIAAEAAKENSAFSLDDRIGLVHDSMALSKAGLQKLSSALTLVDLWKNEKECRDGFLRAVMGIYYSPLIVQILSGKVLVRL